MSVLGMLAWCAAAVSLWLGARGHDGAIARGYRWLAGAAALYCAGLIIAQLARRDAEPRPGAVVHRPAAAAGAGRRGGRHRDADHRGPGRRQQRPAARQRPVGAPARGVGRAGRIRGRAGAGVLPGLADGYVMAVALLVIGWVTLFSAEFHRSGERPGTFLLALVHPLADLAVLGALLPMVTTAWRRVMLPYLSLLAIAVGDALAVGQRVLRRAPGRRGAAAAAWPRRCCSALAPWQVTEGGWTRRTASSAAATVIAALAASAGHPGGDRQRPGGRARIRGRAGGGGRRRACSCWPRGSSCSSGRTGRPRDLAGIQPEPA